MNQKPHNASPPVAFIGFCDRGKHVQEGHPIFWRHHLFGVRQAILAPIFPLDLSTGQLVISIFNPVKTMRDYSIRMLHPDGREVLSLSTSGPEVEERTDNQSSDSSSQSFFMHHGAEENTWVLFLLPIPPTGNIIDQPGHYRITIRSGADEITIGQLSIAYGKSEPLSLDRIDAIKSDPQAAREVRLELSCVACGDTCRVGVAIDKSERKDDYTWYEDVPDIFECKCKSLRQNMKYIKENLHACLGMRTMMNDGRLSLTRLYEEDDLDFVCKEFRQLINEKPSEEQVQKFIEKNKTLLCSFSPHRIFFKKPILSMHKTDIVILTPKRELLLIEIERPDTPLMKKDGDLHNNAQHAIKQVRDWLHEFKENRAAVLKCIGLKTEDVSRARGVVIVGRNKLYDKEKLRKLKSHDYGEVELMTYDDLVDNLAAILAEIKSR
jgi:hypothetical protein